VTKFKKRELSTDEPLGKQLRAVRRTAGLSLDQVEMATKIRRKFIQAIESGSYDEFPAEVYLRGFLENYAQFLGFPADQVLTQYKRERGISGPGDKKKKLDVPKRRLEDSSLTVTPKTLWIGLGFLGVAVTAGYIVSQVFGLAAPPKLELAKPSANQVVTSETVDVVGKTTPGAEVAINNQPVPADPNGNFSEHVRVLSGTNLLRVTAKNKSGRSRAVSRSILVQLPGKTASPTPVPAAAPTVLTMTLKIGPNSAYVTLSADGKTAFQGLLLPGTEQTFTANSRMLLTTSNAGSTHVSLNGQDKGAVGTEGQYRRGIEYLLSEVLPSPSAQPR
jgi:cytoskeletal protein RodZ